MRMANKEQRATDACAWQTKNKELPMHAHGKQRTKSYRCMRIAGL